MSPSTCPSPATQHRDRLWSPPLRLVHWLTAASVMGGTIITSQGDPAHGILGWLALGILLIWHTVGMRSDSPNPALSLFTVVLAGMAVSGWLAPWSDIHAGFTLVALVFASLHSATVLFEAFRLAEAGVHMEGVTFFDCFRSDSTSHCPRE